MAFSLGLCKPEPPHTRTGSGLAVVAESAAGEGSGQRSFAGSWLVWPCGPNPRLELLLFAFDCLSVWVSEEPVAGGVLAGGQAGSECTTLYHANSATLQTVLCLIPYLSMCGTELASN